MAVNQLSIYRVYANTLSSIENLPNAHLGKELQIVLPFARDYDSGHVNTTGIFEANFDTKEFDAETIKDFKKKSDYNEVKFFLSIGGRNPKFPFAVTSADEPTWVQNATDSLTKIVKDYNFDGIDVYYEHINATAESQFASSMFDVISKLKNTNKVITQASITVSSLLDNRYYDLFTKANNRFDFVVYQTHNEIRSISNVKDLETAFDKLLYRPIAKILAGYSDAPSDWAYVTPPIFLGAIPHFLNKGVSGFSKWIVTPNGHNPEP